MAYMSPVTVRFVIFPEQEEELWLYGQEGNSGFNLVFSYAPTRVLGRRGESVNALCIKEDVRIATETIAGCVQVAKLNAVDAALANS
eukprot:scaffold79891_cov32-Tisochrysis_lutea.AAC.1